MAGDPWVRWQTILMALAVGIPMLGGSIAAYVSIRSELAEHSVKLEAIDRNVDRVERTVTVLSNSLLPLRKAEK